MANLAKIPSLLYGTAWKKEQTHDLVKRALISGFRGVDTAAQPKHYREDLVGAGIRSALGDVPIKREDLYIQTKFTSIQGQDPSNMPYDPKSNITEQVGASVRSSLHNLGHTDKASDAYIDCLVLHSPLPSLAQTMEAWQAMESYVPRSVRTLGISNCYHRSTLEELFERAVVKPSVVQNRFYADSGYDSGIRAFCNENNITYQSFWTLTANPHLLSSEPVGLVSRETGVSSAVALYGLVLSLGNVSILNGTTNAQRMSEDLAGVEAIQKWQRDDLVQFSHVQRAFEQIIS